MNKRFRPIIAALLLAAVTLACALPPGGTPAPEVDQVATIVASTLQALTPVNDGGSSPSATSVPVDAGGLLPRSLYYRANGTDFLGAVQVFRMERDGKSQRAITAEPAGVDGYDVSPVDGSVVYVSNNQLMLINADGSNRRILVDNGSVDATHPFETTLSSPVFSPDGQTIAYSYMGLQLYSLATNTSVTAIEEIGFDADWGGYLPSRMYIPQSYSPDGRKMLVTMAIPNSDGFAANIYTLASDTLTPLSGGEGARLCCGKQAWTADSSALYMASASVGMFGSGLWRADANTGNVTTLLPTEAGGGAYNLAAYPYAAPDGNLYYFYNSALSPDGMIDRAPMQIVRSSIDGITGRTVLRPETFNMLNEALWAPDASFVLTADAPIDGVREGGFIELNYTNGDPGPISLLEFALDLKWGP